jgi:hypothetical protein
MEKLDVLVVSASRPHLLYLTLESWRTNVRGVKLRFFIEDDVCDPALSKKINSKNLGTDIVSVHHESPPIGPFRKYHRFAEDPARGDFFVILEDDWILPKPVDFSKMLSIMRARPDVNELILPYKRHPVAPEEDSGVDGIQIVLNKMPLASPALWRTSTLRASANNPKIHRMLTKDNNFKVHRMPSLFLDFYETIKALPADELVVYLREKVGAYMLSDKYARVWHIGCCWKRFVVQQAKRVEHVEHELIHARTFLMTDPADPILLLPLKSTLPANKQMIDKQYALVKASDPTRCSAYLERLLAQIEAFEEDGRKVIRAHLEHLLQSARTIPNQKTARFVHAQVPQHLLPPSTW